MIRGGLRWEMASAVPPSEGVKRDVNVRHGHLPTFHLDANTMTEYLNPQISTTAYPLFFRFCLFWTHELPGTSPDANDERHPLYSPYSAPARPHAPFRRCFPEHTRHTRLWNALRGSGRLGLGCWNAVRWEVARGWRTVDSTIHMNTIHFFTNSHHISNCCKSFYSEVHHSLLLDKDSKLESYGGPPKWLWNGSQQSRQRGVLSQKPHTIRVFGILSYTISYLRPSHPALPPASGYGTDSSARLVNLCRSSVVGSSGNTA
ncbi:hypothetical protein BJ508DRAFT_377713 [Ascobolus immersus RN42]|uniref:Uncharacterized protein n=1 Tax=Ascobolus immersus RN42 TaxID=1160509 RepID=A0A3N4I1S7_ASCIM|nr:hypothetical protein BJ508DRAFT_377713 [Ascobolus immersus RN42]